LNQFDSQKIFGSISCPVWISQTLWFLTNPFLAHDIGEYYKQNIICCYFSGVTITNQTGWLSANPK